MLQSIHGFQLWKCSSKTSCNFSQPGVIYCWHENDLAIYKGNFFNLIKPKFKDLHLLLVYLWRNDLTTWQIWNIKVNRKILFTFHIRTTHICMYVHIHSYTKIYLTLQLIYILHTYRFYQSLVNTYVQPMQN